MAAAFAREYKALITLLHVVVPDGSYVKRNLSRQRLIEEMSEVGEDQLHKLADVIWERRSPRTLWLPLESPICKSSTKPRK